MRLILPRSRNGWEKILILKILSSTAIAPLEPQWPKPSAMPMTKGAINTSGTSLMTNSARISAAQIPMPTRRLQNLAAKPWASMLKVIRECSTTLAVSTVFSPLNRYFFQWAMKDDSMPAQHLQPPSGSRSSYPPSNQTAMSRPFSQ